MNRIEKRMEELQNKNEKAFVTYMTAGLPDHRRSGYPGCILSFHL